MCQRMLDVQLLQIVLKVRLDGPGPSEGKNVQTVAHSPIPSIQRLQLKTSLV